MANLLHAQARHRIALYTQTTTGALVGSLCGTAFLGASISVRLAYSGAAFARFVGLSSVDPSEGLFAGAGGTAAALMLNGMASRLSKGGEGGTKPMLG